MEKVDLGIFSEFIAVCLSFLILCLYCRVIRFENDYVIIIVKISPSILSRVFSSYFGTKMLLFGVCFILHFVKLTVGIGF